MSDRPTAWQHILDELVLRQEPLPWFAVRSMRGLRETSEEVKESVGYLKDRLFICRAGYLRSVVDEILWGPTTRGHTYWKKYLKGSLHRSSKASPLKRWTHGQLAAAQSPRSVFDLARVPWVWSAEEEHRRMGPVPHPAARRQ
jgi:hypothetical protein